MYQLLAKYNTSLSRISHLVAVVVGQLELEISIHAVLQLYGGIRRQSTERQVCNDAHTGGMRIVSFVFLINKPLTSITRFLKISIFSIWKQKNIEGNKWTSFAITVEMKSTTLTRVIYLQQRPSGQRLNRRLNFEISSVLLMSSSKN